MSCPGRWAQAAIWLIERWLLGADERIGLGAAIDGGVQTRTVLAYGVVAPLAAVVLALAGPLFLAARPRFDDMIDGLTFGAVSGAAYAAGETLVMHRGVLDTRPGQRGDVATWLSVVANAAAVKPVVYGTALAIAAAAFSGIGAGYEGFGRRFAKGLGIAVTAMVCYSLGVNLFDQWFDPTPAAVAGLVWGLLIAGRVDRDPAHAAPPRSTGGGARVRSGRTEPPRGHRDGALWSLRDVPRPARAVLQQRAARRCGRRRRHGGTRTSPA